MASETDADADADTGTGSETTIYLAGPVASMADGGASWRDEIIDTYGDTYDFRNPLSKYNVPAQDLTIVDGTSNPDDDHTVGTAEIVESDKQMLRECDGVLLGYSQVHSIGSPMETMWAHERHYPIALWVRDGTDFEDLSPWYRYHATALTNSAELALRHIERQTEDTTKCEDCAGLIDFTDVSEFYKTPDERFWHRTCMDPFAEGVDQYEIITGD